MIQRDIKITFRINEVEHQSLANQIKRTGLTQEAFIRALFKGFEPRELLPLDYHAMLCLGMKISIAQNNQFISCNLQLLRVTISYEVNLLG